MRAALAALALVLLSVPVAAQGSECGSGLTVSPGTWRAGASAGRFLVDVVGPAGCAYDAGADSPWLQVSPPAFVSGGDRVTLTVTYEANPDAAARSSYVSVSDQVDYDARTVYVEQSGRCAYSILGRDAFFFDVGGGEGHVEVSVQGDGCEVAIGSSVLWMYVGSGGDFTVASNDGPERQGVLSIGAPGQVATVFATVQQSGTATGTHPTGGTGPLDRYIDEQIEAPGPGAALLVAGLALAALLLSRRR